MMTRSIAGQAARAMTALAAAVVVVLLATPTPASAHGGGGDATNYRTEVRDPGDPGLSWRVYGGDSLIELTNRTGAEVVIVGYQDEPYLRFTPGDGVFANTRSPTTYLNRERYADVEIPAEADPKAAPSWRQVADGDRFAWHDHRAHWMAPDDPAVVAADPDVEHVVLAWTIPVQIGTGASAESVEASGELRWVPGVASWPPMLIVAAAFLLALTVAVMFTLPDGSRWPGVARTVTVLLWVVIAANLVRTFDDMLAVPATAGQQAVLLIGALFALGTIGALTIVGWRAHAGGFLALGAAGLLMMLFFGADSTDQLSASQIATVLPVWLRRWTVAASYMIVVPAFLAAGLGGIIQSRHLAPKPAAAAGTTS